MNMPKELEQASGLEGERAIECSGFKTQAMLLIHSGI